MFGAGYRTPAKVSQAAADSDSRRSESPKEVAVMEAGTSSTLAGTGSLDKVRRSIGEWETGRTGSNSSRSPLQEAKTCPTEPRARLTSSQKGNTAIPKTKTVVTAELPVSEMNKPKGRVAEAKACLIKAKLQINSSRNLKAEIKTEVIQAVEKLYQLVKEAEAANTSTSFKDALATKTATKPTAKDKKESEVLESDLASKLEEHSKMLRENTEQMTRLKQQMEKLEANKPVTYASVAAASMSHPVHSMVVSSADSQDTSEDVINKIRTAVSAKMTGIRVDRMRKARDQKVVLGCQTREELAKVAEKLRSGSTTLLMEEKANRDPLVIIHSVLNINTDEDVLCALTSQNSGILGVIPSGDYRASVKFRRRARNPLESHVVLQVSPPVWKSLTTAGKVHIDLQRLVVRDQSPLVQCSRCLGYGHGRKNCTESVDTCSHCMGPHLRSECPAWKAGDKPTCRNCQSAKLDQTDHNSFEEICPIRKKWEALARARVAYC